MYLDDLLINTNDITEPACFEKVIMQLDRLQTEDNDFMELLVSKLDNMVITWDQPWYQNSTCLTRPLQKNGEEIEEYHTNTICKEEHDLIVKNWQKFIKIFQIPDQLISFARWRNKDKCRSPNTPEERARQFVTAFLAQGLKRNLYQVYKHIVSYFGSPVKGSYSPEEEKLMKICFYHKPSHAVVYLSLVLGREPRGIYKRLQEIYHGKPEKKRLKWTLSLASKFVNLLIKYSECTVDELKNKKIEKSTWLKVQNDMDQHYIYLQIFWYRSLHVQIFVNKNVKIKQLVKKILKILRTSPYQVWSDIRWKDILKRFPDGFTHLFLYKVCSNIVRSKPDYLKKPLNEVIDYCMNKINRNHKNKRLRRLVYNDGKLEKIIHSNRNEDK